MRRRGPRLLECSLEPTLLPRTPQPRQIPRPGSRHRRPATTAPAHPTLSNKQPGMQHRPCGVLQVSLEVGGLGRTRTVIQREEQHPLPRTLRRGLHRNLHSRHTNDLLGRHRRKVTGPRYAKRGKKWFVEADHVPFDVKASRSKLCPHPIRLVILRKLRYVIGVQIEHRLLSVDTGITVTSRDTGPNSTRSNITGPNATRCRTAGTTGAPVPPQFLDRQTKGSTSRRTTTATNPSDLIEGTGVTQRHRGRLRESSTQAQIMQRGERAVGEQGRDLGIGDAAHIA